VPVLATRRPARILRALAVALLLLLSARVAVARQGPAAPGAITGRVLDKDTGRPVSGADVSVVGTTGRLRSDLDGRFRTGDLVPGLYVLVVRQLGYRPARLENVKVEPGRATPVTVTLETAPVEIQELVVTTTQPTQATSAAGQLALQAAAGSAQDGISAETIERSPDANASEAILRVTGVSVAEDKVVVRGLEERYTNTLVNGVEIASPEPLKRSVPLNIFDASLLESIITSKSATPDRPGDFVGGSVEIKTKDFPENFVASATVATEWNSQSTFRDVVVGPRGGMDWFAFGASRREANETIARDFEALPTRGSPEAARAETFGESIRNVWTPAVSDGQLNTSFSMSAGGQVGPTSSTPIGYVASFTYGNRTERIRDRIFRFSPGIEEVGTIFSNDNLTNSTARIVDWSALANVAMRLGENTKIGFKNFYTREAEETFLATRAFLTEFQQSPLRFIDQARYLERSALQSQLSGEHFIVPLGDTRVEWKLTYSVATRGEPENRELSYAQLETGNPTALTDGDRIQIREFTDRGWIAQVDVGFPVPPLGAAAEFKVGGLYRDRRRQFDGSFYRLRNFQPADTTSGVRELPPEQFWTPEIIGDVFTIQRQGAEAIAVYDGDDDLTAAYGMLDVPLPGGMRLVGGLRVEDWRLNVFIPDREAPLPETRRNRDWLWSANLKIPVSGTSNLRLAAFRTVVRPDIREVAPGIYYPVSGECGIRGNPNLQRGLVNNVDLKYEIFPSPGEIISFSAYYKDFDRPPITVLSGPAGSTCETATTNALSGRVLGAELEVRQRLGFLPGVSTSLNVSFTDSEARLDPSDPFFGEVANQRRPPFQNQSPYLVNVGLNYDAENAGFSASVLLNAFGDRVNEYGGSGVSGTDVVIIPDKIEKTRLTLDAKVRKRFGRIGVTLAGRNLTNNTILVTQRLLGADEVVGRWQPGVGVQLGVTYGL
jgi:hypothetical protein